jgi:hypothetical protein
VDTYGATPTEFLPGESRRVALLKERAALAFHEVAMKNVKPGNIESLAKAEQRFIEMASNPAKALLGRPLAIVGSIAKVLHT